MATNKLFSWTKSERKQLEAIRSGGVVPIPIEYITIKGLDYDDKSKRSTKNPRKPLSLSIDHDFDYASTRSRRTTDSIALQDAAVQSATSLMTVINEMLRSPHLSNFIASQPGLFSPTHGRLRANTAPATPMVEAPVMEPVELVGSSPSLCQRPVQTRMHSYDNSTARSDVSGTTYSAVGGSINRPRSCTQASSCSYPLSSRRSDELARRYQHHSAYEPVPRSRSTDPYQRHRFYNDHASISSMTLTDAAMTKHISRTYDSNPISPSRTPKPYASSSSLGTFRTDSATGMSGYVGEASDQDAEMILMEQLSSMRNAHEVHISSLREAHERELESLRAYVTILEKRRTPLHPYQLSPNHPLTVDTTHPAAGSLANAELSATTSLQSFETSLETQRRPSPDAVAETEALKRKLSLFRKTQADLSDVKRERDLLRETTENDKKRIFQLKDIVRRAKDNDKAMRSAIAGLEGRLEDANNGRVDALQIIHDVNGEVKKLSEREDELLHDREELCNRLFYADPNWDGLVSGKKVATPADINPEVEILREQIDNLQHCLRDREAQVREMEQRDQRVMVNAKVQTDAEKEEEEPSTTSRIELALQQCKERLAGAERERDRFHALLQAEVRRQSRIAAKTSVAVTPRIADEAVAMAVSRVPSLRARLTGVQLDEPSGNATGASSAELEQELKHCMREIIMYKLDIKGYKKDIRKAQAEIDSLQAQKGARPPTPDSGATPPPSKERTRAPRKISSQPVDGLGISLLPPPLTPVKVTKISPLRPDAAEGSERRSTGRPSLSNERETSHKQLPQRPSMSPSPHAARPSTPRPRAERSTDSQLSPGLVIDASGKTATRASAGASMEVAKAPRHIRVRSSASPSPLRSGRQSQTEVRDGERMRRLSVREESLAT